MRLYDNNDRALNDCEAVCGMRLIGETDVLRVYGENLHKYCFLHLDGTRIELWLMKGFVIGVWYWPLSSTTSMLLDFILLFCKYMDYNLGTSECWCNKLLLKNFIALKLKWSFIEIRLSSV